MSLRTLAALGLAGVLAATALTPVRADDQKPPQRLMTLTGRGEVKSKPDMAVVTVGVVRQAATAREALSENNKAMAEVLASLKEQGIAEKDLQTSNFSVNPRFDYSKNQNPPKIEGYEVSNQLAVTVRQLDKLGGILDHVVSIGSNQIFGVAFAIANTEPLADQARKLAVGDALRKAKLFAEAAGVGLGPINQIAEQGGFQPPVPYPKVMRMSAEAAQAVPIAEGEQAVEMQVTITWELK